MHCLARRNDKGSTFAAFGARIGLVHERRWPTHLADCIARIADSEPGSLLIAHPAHSARRSTPYRETPYPETGDWRAHVEIERDLVLDGADAVGWMRWHGWRVIGSSDDFRMTADSARSPEFILKRLWHTAAVTAVELPDDCADFKFVSFVLEGSVTLVTDERARRVSAPSHFFVDETVSVQMASTEPHSRLVVGLPKSLYHWVPEDLTIPLRPYRAEALYREGILNSALASLRGKVRRADDSYRYWTAGMESLALAAVFSATVNDRDGGDSAPTPEEAEAHREVLAEALLFIEVNGHDPQLSVGRLAERLGVSRAHLYRAFQPTGLTPAAHLRRARARHLSIPGINDLIDPAASVVAIEPVPLPPPHKIFV